MGDLRAVVEELGYRDVRTLLNSGNVVFTTPDASRSDSGPRIEKAMATRLGVSARVTVLTAEELATIVGENPLLRFADEPSRLNVAILFELADRARLQPLAKQNWDPDALAIGGRAAYLWCADGMIKSRLAVAVGRVLGDAVTVRNWATMTKLHALCTTVEDAAATKPRAGR